MTAQNRTTLKGYFERGDRPTQSQFADLIDSFPLISGDTMTGPLILSGDPTTGLQAATKSYVDNVAPAVSNYVSTTIFPSANEAAFKAAVNLEIGVDVQAYSANLTTWAGKTAPSGTVIGTTDAQSVSNKTIDLTNIDAGFKYCTAQTDVVNNTTPVEITGLSVTLISGATYIFNGYITGTANASGGAKIANGGTATATAYNMMAENFNGTTTNVRTSTTTLGTAVGGATAVFTDIRITGGIVVNTGGTFNISIGQVSSFGTATSAYVGSWLSVVRVA